METFEMYTQGGRLVTVTVDNVRPWAWPDFETAVQNATGTKRTRRIGPTRKGAELLAGRARYNREMVAQDPRPSRFTTDNRYAEWAVRADRWSAETKRSEDN